jgi:methionine-rich copper-binding protein CopC
VSPRQPAYTEEVTSWKTRALFASVLLGFTVATAPAAWGHNQVVVTTPTAGETVSASPVLVSVQTVENLLDLGGNQAGFAIVVTDQQGLFYGTGCVELSDRVLSTTVELGEGGAYEVIYQFVSEDGHTISDRFGFTFEPRPDHSPAPGYPEAPACGETPEEAPEPSEPAEPPTAPAEVTVEPISAPAEQPGPGVGSIIAGTIGTLAALAAMTFLALRRRR